MKKPFPTFRSDEEAERFVDEADLRDYDFTDMVPVHFELKPKDRTVSLRLPAALLEQVRISATRAGMPYQRFMRLAIERALGKPASK